MAKYKRLVNKLTQARSILITKTGEVVQESIDPIRYAELRKKSLASSARKERDSIMESMGLTKVYGAVSGKVYWE